MICQQHLVPIDHCAMLHNITITSADFDTTMIQLAACLPFSLNAVTQAFKQWVNTTALPWQVAVDYCIDRAIKGKSLPFTVREPGDV